MTFINKWCRRHSTVNWTLCTAHCAVAYHVVPRHILSDHPSENVGCIISPRLLYITTRSTIYDKVLRLSLPSSTKGGENLVVSYRRQILRRLHEVYSWFFSTYSRYKYEKHVMLSIWLIILYVVYKWLCCGAYTIFTSPVGWLFTGWPEYLRLCFPRIFHQRVFGCVWCACR